MATKKYLDNEGLLYFWTKLKSYFVKQESGKGLSANDLTNTLKSNYDAAYTHSTSAHAPSNAERNTIVGIQKNGVDVSIDSSTRKVNISVPVKTSELNNDSGFITGADVPEGAAASTTVPKMAGTAAAGSEMAFARGDHVHPHDNAKVDKVEGKGLSTNDYTTDEKNKLSGIASGAEANVITAVKVNNQIVEPTGKTINISVPTDNNQLTNGAGYQTASQVETAITDKGYQTSAQVESAITAKGYQTAAQVATAIANADHLKRQKVSTLPAIADADVNTIYMVPIASATGDNKFTEWMVIDGAWEKTGDSDVDLSGYVQDSDLSAISNGEIDTVMAS